MSVHLNELLPTYLNPFLELAKELLASCLARGGPTSYSGHTGGHVLVDVNLDLDPKPVRRNTRAGRLGMVSGRADDEPHTASRPFFVIGVRFRFGLMLHERVIVVAVV